MPHCPAAPPGSRGQQGEDLAVDVNFHPLRTDLSATQRSAFSVDVSDSWYEQPGSFHTATSASFKHSLKLSRFFCFLFYFWATFGQFSAAAVLRLCFIVVNIIA